ncbi:MAG: argininosuccinate lyase [Candidatus Nanohaloarchaea archaeon]|nr:argininosuccinate lyase [Candidatus Nanohaloarchaea archaeon]
MKLWETGEEEIGENVESFLATDTESEEELFFYDLLGNIAHVEMLHKQGYISDKELEELHGALLDLRGEAVEITAEDEDVHTKVEEIVTSETEAGKKMHTGRSRNDQVLLDTRLYLKEGLIKTALPVLELAETLKDKGGEEIMPGYTHMRQAMPTTTDVWLGSFAESLLDDLEQLKTAYKLVDQNPLGAAAGYGTTLDIDREKTMELLGFSEVQENPLHCINSRGKFELTVLQSLTQVMLDLSTLANDLILFSTEEFGYVEIPEKYCTGSSIMPQKQNPDVLEMVKGKASKVLSKQSQVQQILLDSNSGYNRETQMTKKPVMEALETVQETVEVLSGLLSGIEFDERQMQEKMKEEIFAAYTANQKVEEGIPFREAYKDVKDEQEYMEPSEEEIVSKSAGKVETNPMKKWWTQKDKEWKSAVSGLLELAEKNTSSMDE